MADRAGGEGKPGVPKEVFELDKDERWQARLDEARARREVALRERAAGKPQKPRPKPWEVDGSDVEKPPLIEPIMQERGDDKFDFADRLETIREAKADRPATSAPTIVPEPEPEPQADVPSQPDPVAQHVVPPVARKSAPEPRARPQPSLILPGAPDVADLAARYAATLDTPAPFTTREPAPPLEETTSDRPSATLVALPTAAEPVRPQEEQHRSLTRSERRRGIRPLGMAIGLLSLAALPLTTEAPGLEVGPDMPVVDVFRIQPALGVTWSLAERPSLTTSSALTSRTPPVALPPAQVSQSVVAQNQITPLPLVEATQTGALAWSEIAPLSQVPPGTLIDVDPIFEPIPVVTEAPLPLALPADAIGPAETSVPVETVAPTPQDAAPVLPEGAVGAPPRPATLQEDVAPPPSPPQPAARPLPSDTVVEADPLRVTILVPARASRALTEDIASNVRSDGHELVRVKDVDFNINDRNVRYFHDADRASAARLAQRYNAELRDFTWFRPRPVEGTAEIWLAGRAPSGNTNGRTRSNVSGDRSDLLERVFDRLGLGTELPNAVPGGDVLRNVLPRADN